MIKNFGSHNVAMYKPVLYYKGISLTTFWLKHKSFGSNFFHLTTVLATINSEPGLALRAKTNPENFNPWDAEY